MRANLFFGFSLVIECGVAQPSGPPAKVSGRLEFNPG